MSIDNKVVIALNILQYTKIICNVLMVIILLLFFQPSVCRDVIQIMESVAAQTNASTYIQAHLSISRVFSQTKTFLLLLAGLVCRRATRLPITRQTEFFCMCKNEVCGSF